MDGRGERKNVLVHDGRELTWQQTWCSSVSWSGLKVVLFQGHGGWVSPTVSNRGPRCPCGARDMRDEPNGGAVSSTAEAAVSALLTLVALT